MAPPHHQLADEDPGADMGSRVLLSRNLHHTPRSREARRRREKGLQYRRVNPC